MTDTLFYKNCGLLLIDLQKGFDEQAYWGGNRNNVLAEEVCFKLLTYWREKQLPIFHIRHASTNPNSPLHPNHAGFALLLNFYPIWGRLLSFQVVELLSCWGFWAFKFLRQLTVKQILA